MVLTYQLDDEAATIEFGRQLSVIIGSCGLCIYLLGDLGAGKTTLSRGIINGLGHVGAVKSPTYTLVEPYQIASRDCGKLRQVYHFDLYRLADPAELEFLGLEDYFSASSLCLIEWPARGKGFIPLADIELTLRDNESGRYLHCKSLSSAGAEVLTALQCLPDTATSTISADIDTSAGMR